MAGHGCLDVVLNGCGELPSREGYAAVSGGFRLAPGGAVSNVAMQLASLLRPPKLAPLPTSSSSSSSFSSSLSPSSDRGGDAAMSGGEKKRKAVQAMTVLGDDDFGHLLLAAWKGGGVGVEEFVSLRTGEWHD